MPEIKRSFSLLKINGSTVERNFKFKTSRLVGSLKKTASIDIKRNYFLSNRIKVNIGDKISLSSKNNNEDLVVLFSGVITNFSLTSAEIHIEARFCCVDDEEMNETYKDTTIKDVLSKFVTDLKYDANDKEQQQIILQGKKEHSLCRLLNNKHFYLDLEDNLVVQDEPQIGKNYIVDKLLLSAKSDRWTIFPIFNLDINDVITLQDIKYVVQGITLDYASTYKMHLTCEMHKEESDSPTDTQEVEEEKEKEEQTEETSEPKLDDLFENPKKLSELHDDFSKYLENTARKLYKKLKPYEKIKINSAARTYDRQIELMVDMLDGQVINSNGESVDHLTMYETYKKTRFTAPYFNILQNFYDGIYNEDNKDKLDEDYESIKDAYVNKPKMNGEARKEAFKTIIGNNPIKNNNEEDVTKVLVKSYKEQKLFFPSLHVTDEIEGHAQAVDLATNNTTATLKKDFDTTGKGTSYPGTNHIHITYKKE